MKQNDEEFLESIAAKLRAPVVPSAGFEARVMRAVREPERTTVLAWVTRPRVIRLSPLAGLAEAACLSLAVLSAYRAVDRDPPSHATVAVGQPVSTSIADTVKLVQFVLVAPSARSVSLVGDFNDWDPAAMPLREAADAGVWSVTVPLSTGRHQYVFMVDGNRWTLDPAAPRAVEDSFGTPNSVITVGESAS